MYACDLFLNGFLFFINHSGKQIQLQYAEFYARFVLNFLLQCISKLCKALVCHYMQNIDILVLNPLSILIDAQAQTASDLLSAGKGGFLIDQRADLEHIGVIPAFFERRMREDKPQRTFKAEQPFLIAHNGVISIIVCQRIAFGIF